jgi:hypothetical protein
MAWHVTPFPLSVYDTMLLGWFGAGTGVKGGRACIEIRALGQNPSNRIMYKQHAEYIQSERHALLQTHDLILRPKSM